MDIKTLNDLGKIADLCRKKGIEQIKITAEGIELKLGQRPQAKTRANKSNSSDKIETDSMTEEQALFWSSDGIPSERQN